MAITKAQQARQMLIKGGVVHSDGRRGFFTGAERDARAGRGDISPGTDRQGNQRPGGSGNPRRGGAGPFSKPTSTKPKAPPGRSEVGSAPKINRFKLAQENKERKEREEKEKKRKQEAARTGLDTTTKFGTPTAVRPGSPDIRGFKDIEFLKGAIEDDDEDDVATAKAIVEQNPLQKFLSNIKPVSLSVLENVLPKNPFDKIIGEIKDDPALLEKVNKRLGPEFDLTDEDDLQKYKDLRTQGVIGAYGRPMGGFKKGPGGEIIRERDNEIIPQVVPTTTAPTTTTSEAEAEDVDDINRALAIRFAGSEFDFADGGRVPAMGGGIMNTDVIGGFADGSMDQMGRQMYGLGKLVKSVTKGVKKIVKSPIGKAALIGAGFGLAGMGPFSALKGSSLGKFLVGTGLPTGTRGPANTGLLGKLLLKKGASGFSLANLSPMKTLGIVSALPLLFGTGEEEEEQDLYRGPSIDIPAIRRNPYSYMAPRFEGSQFAADGGRIGYDTAGAVMSEEDMKKLAKSPLYKGFKRMYGIDPQGARENKSYEGKLEQFEQLYKQGFQEGGKAEPVAKKTMPLIDMDGMEKDYRETGGFVEMGRMERADDVPARLSKNEFVFTADAVRNAGDGNIDKGAEVMYNMMKNLEAGGEVSEESQGLEGARKMFQTSQRLGEVI